MTSQYQKKILSAEYFWCWEMGRPAKEARRMVETADFEAVKSWAVLGSILFQKTSRALWKLIVGE